MTKNLTFISAALSLLAAAPCAAAVPTVAVSKGSSGWSLTVDGQPFLIKGVAYIPERVGEDPSLGNLRNWQDVDDNRNGQLDSPYDAFVDVNHNSLQDPAEPAIGDFALMRDMGVNTVRIYHHSSDAAAVQAGYGNISNILKQYNHTPNKAVLRDLHDRFGISVAMGDFFGAYRVGSGVGVSTVTTTVTDYSNPTQVARMLVSVDQMVTDYKDESFLLMYVLGNENNYASLTFTNALADPASFASAIGQAVALIKSKDASHPVAIALGDYPQTVIDALKALPADRQPDILGANVYRYPAFETFFSDAANGTTGWDKPVMFTEYGDQATQFIAGDIDQTRQSTVMTEGWNDIVANTAGGAGADNAIGGFAFEWLDNWWQSGAPNSHTINGLGGFENEWHGIAAQGSGQTSPFVRQLRTVYTTFQALWGAGTRTVPAAGARFIYPFSGSYAFVDVPGGALPAGTTLALTPSSSFPSAAGAAVDVTGTGTGFTLTASGGAQPTRPLTIYFPFSHGGGSYVVARYDVDHAKWVTLPTRRDSTGALIATTDHLSQFQVMSVPAPASTAQTVVYPNPARPARGDAGMNFAQVPAGTRVDLYSQAGEFVRELAPDVTGLAFWDLKNDAGRAVASGVYFAVIDGPGGRRTVSVAVQR